ncbi:MAG TPA: FHA domain-containing protein [Nevskiaceae bacterium]|nr:FHA domain-containing protein [Nevskiaceae bacterium]
MLLAAAAREQGSSLGSVHQSQLRRTLQRAGTEIAATGSSEFLAVYPRLDLALEAALSFLRSVEHLEPTPNERCSGRVVLDIWPEGSDAQPVDRLYQIMDAAEPDALLVTAEAATQLGSGFTHQLMEYRPARQGKTLSGVFELPWREEAGTYREKTRHVVSLHSAPKAQMIRLSRRGSSLTVHPEDCPFSIGRDAACAMIVGGANVSRLHGAVIHEGGRFHYRDDSRNGSFVTAGGREVFLHSDRYPLFGDGVISPGSPLADQSGDVIRFSCLTAGEVE